MVYLYCKYFDDGNIVWDENKNVYNKRKHKVSFEEARTVFSDERAVVYDDPDHSKDEDRFLILGFSTNHRILVVSHCYRENDQIIRIISARKATKREALSYEEEI